MRCITLLWWIFLMVFLRPFLFVQQVFHNADHFLKQQPHHQLSANRGMFANSFLLFPLSIRHRQSREVFVVAVYSIALIFKDIIAIYGQKHKKKKYSIAQLLIRKPRSFIRLWRVILFRSDIRCASFGANKI